MDYCKYLMKKQIVVNVFFAVIAFISILYLYYYIDLLSMVKIKNPLKIQYVNLSTLYSILLILFIISFFIKIKKMCLIFLIILCILNIIIVFALEIFSIETINVIMFSYMIFFACFSIINFVYSFHYALNKKIM